jgi:hypothetical protein
MNPWLMSDKQRQRQAIIDHLKAGIMIGIVAVSLVVAFFFGG